MHVRLCVPLYVRMHARMHASGTHVDITLHTQIPSAVAQIGSRLKKRPANLLEVHDPVRMHARTHTRTHARGR